MPLSDALFTVTQQKILGLLYGKPDQSFYANEIARRAQVGKGSLMRELDRLHQAGILTLNRQGNDLGPSYRSGIYTLSQAQADEARRAIGDVDASGLWPGRVVTEVRPAGPFWQAEPEHQDYLERIPNGYTCHFIRPGWRLPKVTV